MTRTRTPVASPKGVARELAGLVAQSAGPPELAALAVLGRFLVPDEDELAGLVSRLPTAARDPWTVALDLPVPFAACYDRDALFSRTDQEAAPVLAEGHLFERFLAALDRQQRRRRGVFFTPKPLVDYLLRSAQQALADHFDSAARIHLIDPACGYGAFLLTANRAGIGGQFVGCEVCTITWAVAHLLLAREGCSGVQLLHVNPLAEGEALTSVLLGPQNSPQVPVIVGNPPWSNFGRQNRSPWMNELLADYRTGLAERKSNLADDAIKFIRWGQHWIDRAGRGILAFVTPNTWLDGLTHRAMRESLLKSFDAISVVDLHGEADRTDDDENVFGVRSGVALVVMIRQNRKSGAEEIRRIDLTGSRLAKFTTLNSLESSSQSAILLSPASPAWSFAIHHAPSSGNYDSFWPLNRIFRQYISGVQTKNDAVFVGFTPGEVAKQVRGWLAASGQPVPFDEQHIRPYLVAPFDRRWVYYDPRLIGRARYEVMRHMLRPNLALVFMRQSTAPGEYDHFLAVDSLVSDRVFYSRRGAPFLAPLWVEEGARGSGLGPVGSGFQSNLDLAFVAAAEEATGVLCEPPALFHYLYAVCHAPTYRRRYDTPLRRDFPRLPLPANREAFERLSELGGKLVELHVISNESQGPGPGLVPAIDEMSDFRVGGYDVIRRWRAQRKRRMLTKSELAYVERLEIVAAETARLASEIDQVWSDRHPASRD